MTKIGFYLSVIYSLVVLHYLKKNVEMKKTIITLFSKMAYDFLLLLEWFHLNGNTTKVYCVCVLRHSCYASAYFQLWLLLAMPSPVSLEILHCATYIHYTYCDVYVYAKKRIRRLFFRGKSIDSFIIFSNCQIIKKRNLFCQKL